MSAAAGAVALLAYAALGPLAQAQRDIVLVNGAVTEQGLFLLAIEIGAPALAAILVITAGGMAAVAVLAHDLVTGSAPSVGGALALGARRAPAVLATVAAAVLVTAVTVIVTPLLVPLALLVLALTPLLRRAARRPRSSWLSVLTVPRLVACAVPFGPAVCLTIIWMLALPLAALEHAPVRERLRRSHTLVRRHLAPAVLTAGVAVLIYAAVQAAIGLLGLSLLSTGWVTALTVASQTLLGAVPIVALTTVLARSRGPIDRARAVARDRARVSLQRSVTATVAISALVVGLAVSPGGDAAHAAPVFTITSLGDAPDAAPGDGVCATASTGCTLRAAVDEVNALAGDTVNVYVAVTGTISIASPLVLTARMQLNGDNRIVISGGGTTQLIRAEGARFSLYNLVLTGGSAATGGAAIQANAGGTLFGVTFSNNQSASGGSAFTLTSGGYELEGVVFSGNSVPACAWDPATVNIGGSVASMAPATDLSCPGSPAEVIPGPSTTTLSAPTTIGYAEPTTVTATVVGGDSTPVGVVVFSRDGTEFAREQLTGLGTASATLPLITPGSAAISASYEGEGWHLSSSTQQTVTVGLASTTVAITPSVASPVTGQPVVYTASVRAAGSTPGGTVYFATPIDRTVTLDAAGDASVTVDPVRAGSVTVSYAGDALHATSTQTRVQAVADAPVEVVVGGSTSGLFFADDAVFTVTVAAVAPSTGSPNSGTLTLIASRSGDPDITLGTGPVGAGGVAQFTVDGGTLDAGTYVLTGRYRNDTGGYTDGDSSPVSVTVAPIAPTLTLSTAPSPSPLNATVTVTATLGALRGVEANGVIEISVDGTPIATAAAESVNGGWALSSGVPGLTAGTHEVTASFLPSSANWTAAVAPAVLHSVSGPPTATVLETVPSSAAGAPAYWQVRVSAVQPSTGAPVTLSRPEGAIEFRVDGALVSTVSLQPGTPLSAVASLEHAGLAAGSHTVIATYVPSDPHATSTTTWNHMVTGAALSVAPTSGAWSTPWGVPFSPSVTVTLPAGGPAPTQGFTVSDGAGRQCVAVAVSGVVACALTWPDIGTYSVTVSYPGDAHYAPVSSIAVPVTVTASTPVITASLSTLTPETDVPVALTWAIAAGATGSVVVSVNGQVQPCATSVSGSCAITFGANVAGAAQSVAISFTGTGPWANASWTSTITPQGCRTIAFTSSPLGAGTVQPSLAPNCGNGTGYLHGTVLTVAAVAAASTDPTYGWAAKNLQLPAGTTTAGTQGSFTVTAGTTVVIAFFTQVFVCYPVTLSVQQTIAGSGSLRGMVNPTCPTAADGTSLNESQRTWVVNGATRTGRFLAGTTFTAKPFISDAETVAYGYRWNGATTTSQLAPTAIVVDRAMAVSAVFGPQCYQLTAALDANAYGSARLSAPTCNDPRNAWAGWRAGDTATVTAVPDFDGGYIASWEGTSAVPTRTLVTSAASWRETQSVQVAVTAGDPARVITATMSSCARVTLAIESIAPASGTARIVTPGTCPVPGIDSSWYARGTSLTLEANTNEFVDRLGNRENSLFGGWHFSGVTINEPSTSFLAPITSRVITASFMPMAVPGCVHVTMTTWQPDWVIGAAGSRSTRALCPAAEPGRAGTTVTSQGYVYVAPDVPVVVLSASALQGNPMLGFAVNGWQQTPHRFVSTAVAAVPTGSTGLWTATVVNPTTDLEARAVACQGIDARVLFGRPGEVPQSEAANPDAELVMYSPAPNCPFAANAWLVGTTVEVAALGDPAGYTFTGWGNAASGTGLRTTVALDGSSPSVTLTASYQVHCFLLTLTHDAADVRRSDEPNCPDVSRARQGYYVGGTVIALQGTVPAGKVWDGWTGGVVKPGKTNPAFVLMDADKSAGHRWHSPDAGEQTTRAAEQIGNYIAIGAKKLTGVLAIGLSEFIAGAPPFGLVGSLVATIDVIGTVLDSLGVSSDITQYFHYVKETYDWAFSVFSCAAAWSFAGNGGGPSIGGGASTAEERLRSSLDAYDTASTVNDTAALIAGARTAYFKGGAGKLLGEAEMPGSVGMGLAVAGQILDSGIGLDANAHAAWTDGSVFTSCMSDSVPGYL